LVLLAQQVHEALPVYKEAKGLLVLLGLLGLLAHRALLAYKVFKDLLE
jgi:hypothetical protein